MANSGNSVSSPPEKPTKPPVSREIDFGPFPPQAMHNQHQKIYNKTTSHPPNSHHQPNLGPSIIHIVSSSENTNSAARPQSHLPQMSINLDAPRHQIGQPEKKRKCKVHSKQKKKSACKGPTSGSRVPPTQQFKFIGQDRADICITLMSSNPGDTGLPFVMKQGTSLRFPCKHYAECIDVCPHDIKLIKDGKELNKHSSVEENALNDGDNIFVEGVDPFINVDTRYKLITIQELTPHNQVTLQHMAPLTLTMEELHQLWAKFSEKDAETFVLVYNGGDIRRSQKTVAEAGFMNEDIIYCRLKDPAQSSGTLGSSDF